MLCSLLALSATALFAAEASAQSNSLKQVMPALRRAQILATAKALFAPEVKKSIKVGRVENPFGSVK
jgi:hypothetical protein